MGLDQVRIEKVNRLQQAILDMIERRIEMHEDREHFDYNQRDELKEAIADIFDVTMEETDD